jgi:hypothetical protein
VKAEFKFDSDEAGRKLKEQASRRYHAARRRAQQAKERAPYAAFMGLIGLCWLVVGLGFLSLIWS